MLDLYYSSPHIESGQLWYSQARVECLKIAWEHSLRLETVIGIVAVMSPRLYWGKNILYAKNLIKGSGPCAVIGANKQKAKLVLNGADPLDILSGLKVRSFYSNILWAGTDNEVTIDGWMLHLMGYKSGYSPKPNLYKRLADIIREQAGQVSIPAPQYQAVLWMTARGK